MARYTFFTQAARDGSNIAASSEELTNCYPEVAPGDARTRLNIRSVLGQQAFATIDDVLVRAVEFTNDTLYVVMGSTLYSVDSAGVVTNIGGVTSGPLVTIRRNEVGITIAANGSYYVWDGVSLTQPLGGAFSVIGSIEFTDYDTIRTERNGRRFDWSATADATLLNALDFASAEAREGTILRPIADKSQLYLFSTGSIEVWYNTGASGANRPSRYQRLAVIDQGLKGYHLVTGTPNAGVFFIGNDDIAYATVGAGLVPLSTPAVNTDILNGNPVSCVYYEDRGHKFCAIIFSDRPAWVYDLVTQVWHRRVTGVGEDDWDVRRIVKAFDTWVAVDDSGNVSKLERVNADLGNPLKRTIRGKPIDLDGRQFSVAEFEFLCSVGTSDIGRDAEVIMRVSWDGGLTWSSGITESMGDLGDYSQQVIFRALGRGEIFTPEFSITDPSDIVVYSDARITLR